MARIGSIQRISSDVLHASRLVILNTRQRNLKSWIYIPIGLLLILLACFGVNGLISLSSVTFPASVACMILLFFGLIICNSVVGDRKTKQIISTIDLPARFALRFINIFFIPSFILLPLSPPISGIEVGKIIAVFILGFTVMVAITAYMVRGLQLLLGSSKRGAIERAQEMGNEEVNIPLTDRQLRHGTNLSGTISYSYPGAFQATLGPNIDAIYTLTAPERAQDPNEVRGIGGSPISDIVVEEQVRTATLRQDLPPLNRPQRWAAFINSNFDRIMYAFLFTFVGLPIYFATGYAMPAHLTFSVLAYFAAVALPGRWQQFLHPVLVASAITIPVIWALGLIRGESLVETLGAYKTNTRYIQLWRGQKGLRAPGAGDIFGSVLDASIVALAIPMFQYRKELKQHFVAIVIPNVTLSIASVFGYPAVCYAIGISSSRSLSFAARSLTLALATPAVNNIRGHLNIVAALCIMSGILGVLIGPRMLKWLRIPEDDYVTRGVTLGGNSSAIATALLLMSDPRAAALSSLSMSLFGTITVALTSVPSVSRTIQGLAGL